MVMSSWARAFPGTPRQVAAARRFAASLLAGSPLRDDAVTIVSELFTNSVRHSSSGRPGGLVIVQVTRWRHGVRIAVTDQGAATHPVIRHPGHDGELTETGSGLFIVGELSRQLDWHDHTSGRTVHATLGTHPPGQGPRPRSVSSARTSPPARRRIRPAARPQPW